VLTTIAVDFYRIDDLLSERQRALRDELRAYCEDVIWPQINPFWERAEFPRELAFGLRDLPIWGGMLHGPGCAGLDAVSFGLTMHELARGDGSISTFYGVQSGLTMGAMGLLGSAEQQQRWLPGLGKLELLGAFGLTEPERGSDASHLLTTARRKGDGYVLNGAKRWIGCASMADLLIIWARDDEGGIGAFVVERPNEAEGLRIENIQGKIAKRAIPNAQITLTDVRVPAENRLAESRSFRDTARVLAFTRYGVAWEAVGAAAACFELALRYAKEREQFGRPIGKSQLVQQKLVEMAAELTAMQMLSLQMARLMDAGQLSEGQVSMAKYHNARKARVIAQLARETLGGNGILIEHHVARHFADIEAVYTYEGTSEINMLVAGRELTGLNAIV
jgi:glutaryl-CoA dehydrogenase